MTDPNDDMLDDLFAEARRATPPVSGDLMARVLADADQVQPRAMAMPRIGRWASLLDALGGWPSVGGLVAATVAGIWIGVAPPAIVDDWLASVAGDAVSISLLSGPDGFAEELLADG